MKKLSLFIFSSIFALIILGTSVEAAEINVDKMTPTEAPNIFYDKELGGYYDVNSGGYIEVFEVKGGEVIGKVDMEDYVKRQASIPNLKKVDSTFQENKVEKSPIVIAAPTVWYRYTESSNHNGIQYGSRASIIQKNPGPGNDTFTISYSYTQGHSFSVSLNTPEKSAIKGSVGYTWQDSASITGSHSMTIPAGYQGYWRFDPRVRISNGIVRQYTHGVNTGSKNVKVIYPVKVGKFLDGELVAVKIPL